MRSLRGRLFVAILGTVLLAVGASLALGAVLTKDAVRDTIREDVERQADSFATQVPRLRAQALGPPPGLGGPPPGAGQGTPPAGAGSPPAAPRARRRSARCG